jgi:hypothetical protein
MLDDYISPFPTVNNVGNFDISAALRVVQGRQSILRLDAMAPGVTNW